MESSNYIFYKMEDTDKIWWVEYPCEKDGDMLFSFDRKTVFNFFEDYPDKLTEEQRALFREENPVLAELKEGSK